MSSLWSLLKRRRGFRQLWLGETTSLLGEWLSYVAISLLALQSGGGALALAVVFAGHVLPAAMVSPFAGVLADRLDRRSVLIGTQLLQASLTAAMALAAAHELLIAVQLLLFARTAVVGFFYPAKQAALPRVVAEDELVDANAIDAATWSVTFAVGTALGGVLALAGPVVALSVDTLTFMVSAALFSGLKPLKPEASSNHRDSLPRPAALTELGNAIRFAWRRPALAESVLAKTPLAVAGGATWILLNVTADDIGLLGSSALALGLLQAVRGTGTGVGPLLTRSLAIRGIAPMKLLRAAMIVLLLAVAAFTWFAYRGDGELSWWLALLVAAFVWGLGSGSIWVLSSSEIQRRTPDAMQGRLASADQLCFMLGQSAAAIGAGLLVDATGIAASAGLLGVVCGSALWLLLLSATAWRTASSSWPTRARPLAPQQP